VNTPFLSEIFGQKMQVFFENFYKTLDLGQKFYDFENPRIELEFWFIPENVEKLLRPKELRFFFKITFFSLKS